MRDRFEVSAGLAASVMSFSAARGIDADPIARACGLDPQQFGSLHARIGLEKFTRFLEALAALSGNATFGLEAGAAFEKGATGALGYALICAPTVRDALEVLRLNLRKTDTATNYRFAAEGNEYCVRWTYSPLLVRREQFVDMGFAILVAHFRSMLGPDIDRLRIEMERPRPHNVSIYKDLLGKNVVFAAARNLCAFPLDVLSRRNDNADPRLFGILMDQLDRQQAEISPDDDLVAAARHFVLASIGQDTPGLARTSAHLRMSERTLQRRLSEAGTSLQDIVDDSRRELAMRLLVESDLSLAEISYRLGFSAQSAFSRSAARWFGLTPSQYRSRHRPKPT